MKAEKVFFWVLIVGFLSTKALAQSSCTSVLISLSPCLTYITGNSSTPSPGCCTQLASVVGSQPECLCEVINNSPSLGISINRTQALKLPNACNVQTPPVSRCNAASPAASPGASPGGDSSDGIAIKMPLPLSSFLIIAAYYALTLTTI